MLTIYDVFKLQVGKLVYKSINKSGPSSSLVNFTLAAEVHSHDTRYATHGNIYTNSVRTMHYGLKSIVMEGKHIWRDLPLHIRTSPSIKSFTFNYKDYLISSYIDQ